MFSQSDLCSQIQHDFSSQERRCPLIQHNQLPAPRTDHQTSPKTVHVCLHWKETPVRANLWWQAPSSHNFLFGLVTRGNKVNYLFSSNFFLPQILKNNGRVQIHSEESTQFLGILRKKYKQGEKYKWMPQLQQSPDCEELLYCWVATQLIKVHLLAKESVTLSRSSGACTGK